MKVKSAVVLCNGREKKNLFIEKKGIEFIIFGKTSAHFAYQGFVIGRGLFYSRIEVPSLLQFSRSQAAPLQSEGPPYRFTFPLLFLFFFGWGIFTRQIYPVHHGCSVLLWVLLAHASQPED